MTRISDVMHREVIAVREDMSIQDLALTLTQNRISGAPVLDKEGKMVGVVSLSDVAAHASRASSGVVKHRGHWGRYWDTGMLDDDLLNDFSLEDFQGQGQVKDIMTPAVYTISPEASMLELAEFLLKGQIHRVLVCENDQVLGIVTTTDMLRAFRDHLAAAHAAV